MFFHKKTQYCRGVSRKSVQTCVVSFIYWKSKQYCNFLLHMTSNADIFCISVPHWSHGATQSWFCIFKKCFIFLCKCSFTTLWKCMANEKQCAKYCRNLISNLIAVSQSISDGSNYLSFPTYLDTVVFSVMRRYRTRVSY